MTVWADAVGDSDTNVDVCRKLKKQMTSGTDFRHSKIFFFLFPFFFDIFKRCLSLKTKFPQGHLLPKKQHKPPRQHQTPF